MSLWVVGVLMMLVMPAPVQVTPEMEEAYDAIMVVSARGPPIREAAGLLSECLGVCTFGLVAGRQSSIRRQDISADRGALQSATE